MTAPARGGGGGRGVGVGGQGGRGEGGGRGGGGPDFGAPLHKQPKSIGGGETSPPDLGARLWVHTEAPPPPRPPKRVVWEGGGDPKHLILKLGGLPSQVTYAHREVIQAIPDTGSV